MVDPREPGEDAAGDHPPDARRSIRSYVLRTGRITEAQTRSIAELLPRFGIPFSPAPLDLVTAFGRNAPKVLEIGFGMGETTARIAQSNPEIDYLAIEVHTPGVGGLLNKIRDLGLTNVRIIQHDAVEVLETMIPPASLDGAMVMTLQPNPCTDPQAMVNPEDGSCYAPYPDPAVAAGALLGTATLDDLIVEMEKLCNCDLPDLGPDTGGDRPSAFEPVGWSAKPAWSPIHDGEPMP